MARKNLKETSFSRKEVSATWSLSRVSRFFVSLLSSVVITALLYFLFGSPYLGKLYDLLIKFRPKPAISHEILIIDSNIDEPFLIDDILDPSLMTSVLYSMSELGAGTLIIQVPILGLSIGGSAGEEEILRNFYEEFAILNSNIRNLFDGIRTGSVAPIDSERYVRELIELSESGMDRLINILVHRDEEDIISMENAADLFGQARRPGDLLVQLIRTGTGGRPGALAASDVYSRAVPDRDGIIRRIRPVMTVSDFFSETAEERSLEHIVWNALKDRVGLSVNALPLDRNGAIIFGLPIDGINFRRISILDFLLYDEADQNLRRLLSIGDGLGIFRNIYGENRPDILYDFALALREEPPSSFDDGNEGRKELWVETRNMYFQSLEEFLNGPTEMDLVIAYEEMLDAGTISAAESRDAVIRLFSALRASHSELLEIRNKLNLALYSSFCILGNNQDVNASALLANSVLTGKAIIPGKFAYLFLGSLLATFLTCLFINRRGLFSTLVMGFVLTLLFAVIFCLILIFFDLWLDPQIVAVSCAAGVMASFSWALTARRRHIRHFRLAFGPFVSRSCLKTLIQTGKPLPSQTITTRAIVVAIKQTQILASTGLSDPAKALLVFQEKVSEIFKKAGGTIVGIEGDLVVACFGSPLAEKSHDRITLSKNAVNLVSEITLHPECISWNFGLDAGNCIFTWTALSGYFAIGAAVQKAKVLSRLADRYQSRIVLSAALADILPTDFRKEKLDVIKNRDGVKEEPFFKLVNN